jgi:hypothetical protein
MALESSNVKTSHTGISPEYVTGLCEGSSTFTYVKNGKAINLRFAVKLPEGDKNLIFQLQGFFQTGNVYNSGGTWMYCATSLASVQRIVHHFHTFPLKGKKAEEFKIWSQMFDAKRVARKADPVILQNLAESLSALRK